MPFLSDCSQSQSTALCPQGVCSSTCSSTSAHSALHSGIPRPRTLVGVLHHWWGAWGGGGASKQMPDRPGQSILHGAVPCIGVNQRT